MNIKEFKDLARTDIVPNRKKMKFRRKIEFTRKIAKKPRSREEFTHQYLFFNWLTNTYPEIRKVSFAIPNGGKRDEREAANLKRSGVTAGVPDIFIAWPTYYPVPRPHTVGCFCGLFIEIKAKDRKPSPKQEEMIKNLRRNGYDCRVSYSLEQSIQILRRYLGIDNNGVDGEFRIIDDPGPLECIRKAYESINEDTKLIFRPR